MVTDRDTVLAVSGAPRRDYCDKGISAELEQVMRARSISCPGPQERVPIAVGADRCTVSAAAPILAQVATWPGCVVLARSPGEGAAGTSERTLISAAAGISSREIFGRIKSSPMHRYVPQYWTFGIGGLLMRYR